MAVALQTIRYYNATSPYHYTADNIPLQDLEQNDLALKAAVDSLSQTVAVLSSVGDWSTLQPSFSLQQDINKAFAYRIKVWGIRDQSNITNQSSTILEDTVVGWNANPGTVNVSVVNNVFTHNVGTGLLGVTYTGSGNNLILSFTGYTGNNGYVLVKLERFGI